MEGWEELSYNTFRTILAQNTSIAKYKIEHSSSKIATVHLDLHFLSFFSFFFLKGKDIRSSEMGIKDNNLYVVTNLCVICFNYCLSSKGIRKIVPVFKFHWGLSNG